MKTLLALAVVGLLFLSSFSGLTYSRGPRMALETDVMSDTVTPTGNETNTSTSAESEDIEPVQETKELVADFEEKPAPPVDTEADFPIAFSLDWSAFPLDADTTYVIAGWIADEKEKIYFAIEINKAERQADILCREAARIDENPCLAYALPVVTLIYTDAAMSITVTEQGAEEGEEGGETQEPMDMEYLPSEHIYVYGTGLVASKDQFGIVYHHQDTLGSNRFLTNELGQLVRRNVQNPYGTGQEDIGSGLTADESTTFTGKEQDETLYYFGARHYDPTTGRFLSVDEKGTPLTSPYAYANNNPVRFTAPGGQYAIDKNSYQRVRGLTEENVVAFVEFAKSVSPAARQALGEQGTFPSISIDPSIESNPFTDGQAWYAAGKPEISLGSVSLWKSIVGDAGVRGQITLSGVTTFDDLATLVHESTHRLQHVEDRSVGVSPHVHDALFHRQSGFVTTLEMSRLDGLSSSELDAAKAALRQEIEAQRNAYDALREAQKTAPQAFPGLNAALSEHASILQRLQTADSMIEHMVIVRPGD